MKILKKIFPYQNYLMLTIKLILVLSIFNAINLHLWHLASTNIFLLVLMFIPQILKKSSKMELPKEFELILLGFVIITLFLGKVSTVIAPIIFGIATGLIGFTILLFLYSSNQIKKNYLLMILFSLNFAIALGVIIELAKYYLKLGLGQAIDLTVYSFTMMNLTYVILGSIIASIIGYIYMKTHLNLFGKIIKMIKKSNPKLTLASDFSKEILELIKQGEKEKLEFKSTLRTNLHTNEIDKKIENNVLKTIIAFLNTRGGTLLIGVSDNKEIIGIEKDNFSNNDKFHLHLVNLIKQKIGKKYLSSIDFQTGKINNKTVVRIDCNKSKKSVFLREGKEEEFYIRAGPSTTELKASSLIDYINQRNKEKD